MSSPADLALLAGAGLLAGTLGSAGAITSLVSYPALLAVGIAPVPANVTNAVALVGSFTGSAAGSRPELAGQLGWLARWAPLMAMGSAGGVVLLLSTPSRLFARIVPFLLVAAVLALLVQPLAGRVRPGRGRRAVLAAGLAAMALYSGYFGAGSGVMVLALLLATAEQQVRLANALKNMLLGIADLVAAIGFAAFGPVQWGAVLPLFCGLVAGSALGPAVVRRVPELAVRLAAAAAGVGLAVWFWVSPG